MRDSTATLIAATFWLLLGAVSYLASEGSGVILGCFICSALLAHMSRIFALLEKRPPATEV